MTKAKVIIRKMINAINRKNTIRVLKKCVYNYKGYCINVRLLH